MASLLGAKSNGVRTIMFTSNNFNKFPETAALLEAMIDEQPGLSFFVQCDTQIDRKEHLMELRGKAGCFQMFVGLESFDRQTLLTEHIPLVLGHGRLAITVLILLCIVTWGSCS